MSIEFIEHGMATPTHVVRTMSPLGAYPVDTIINGEYAFYCSEDICFSVVPFSSEKLDIDHYYSEVEWATINEIILYSSILLCIDRGISFCRIYPFNTSHKIVISNEDSIANNFSEITYHLIEAINAPPKVFRGHAHPATNPYRTSHGISLPPVCGGPNYVLRTEGYNYKLQLDLMKNFDRSDYLLIRGVSTLLRSSIITAHYHFLEEAINTTFISLEASFRLVLRKLKEMGINNPSSKDAGDYIAKVFHSPYATKYFEDYYVSRIMAFHPESRFGTFPHAPLMADDCYDLFDDLIEVYRFLICRYLHPKHMK